MGLDMNVYGDVCIHTKEFAKTFGMDKKLAVLDKIKLPLIGERTVTHAAIRYEVMYWRKQYELMDVLSQVLGGIENCRDYDLDEEQLKEAKQLFIDCFIDKTKTLDTTSWGDTKSWCDTDEEYIDSMKNIVKNLDDLIKFILDNKLSSVTFHAWW